MNSHYLLLPLIFFSTFLYADSQRHEPSLFLEYEREVSRSTDSVDNEEMTTFKKIVTKIIPSKPQAPFAIMIPTSPTITNPSLPEKPSVSLGDDSYPYLLINKPENPKLSTSQYCLDSQNNSIASNLKPKKNIMENITSLKERLLVHAKEFLGTPYGYGNKGVVQTDCSGFTQQVFQKLGIVLPHSTIEQATLGTYVNPDDLQVGDLMFYHAYKNEPSHVGIYVGDRKIIHASFRNKQVQYDAIDKGYFQQHFMYAKRLTLNKNDR